MDLLAEVGGSLLSFALVGVMIYLCGLIFYRLITSDTISLPIYVLIDAIGAGLIGPAALMATAMGSASGEDLFLVSLFSYGVIGGIITAFICIILGSAFILAKKQSQARKILKIPIIYAGVWIISFVSVGLFNSLHLI
jgi:hypothetical protein